MDANEIKINRKRRLDNTSISDFFKPKVCNTDGNNNASSSVISKDSEQGKGNDSNQCTLPPVVTTPDISIEDRIPLFIFEIPPPFLDQGGNSPTFIKSWQHLCISETVRCRKLILGKDIG